MARHPHPSFADYHLGLVFVVLAAALWLVAAALAFGALEGGPSPLGLHALGMACWAVAHLLP